MKKLQLVITFAFILPIIFIAPKESFASECRTLRASSPISYITYNIGTSNTHIAERMRSGHVYPTRLQTLRILAQKTGRRVDPANPVAGFLNFNVTCRIFGRTYSRSSRRVVYKHKCFATGRICSLSRTRPVGRAPWRP